MSISWDSSSNQYTPGVLDLPPFTDVGTADSFFDVFFEIEVGGFVFRTEEPKRMETIISYKPPQEGDTYENPQLIPLVDLQGQPTGFFIGPAFHTPTPPPEVEVVMDFFHTEPGEFSDVFADFITIPGAMVTATLSGPGVISSTTLSGTTDPEGFLSLNWQINLFGTYTVTGTANGIPFSASINVQ